MKYRDPKRDPRVGDVLMIAPDIYVIRSVCKYEVSGTTVSPHECFQWNMTRDEWASEEKPLEVLYLTKEEATKQ